SYLRYLPPVACTVTGYYKWPFLTFSVFGHQQHQGIVRHMVKLQYPFVFGRSLLTCRPPLLIPVKKFIPFPRTDKKVPLLLVYLDCTLPKRIGFQKQLMVETVHFRMPHREQHTVFVTRGHHHCASGHIGESSPATVSPAPPHRMPASAAEHTGIDDRCILPMEKFHLHITYRPIFAG